MEGSFFNNKKVDIKSEQKIDSKTVYNKLKLRLQQLNTKKEFNKNDQNLNLEEEIQNINLQDEVILSKNNLNEAIIKPETEEITPFIKQKEMDIKYENDEFKVDFKNKNKPSRFYRIWNVFWKRNIKNRIKSIVNKFIFKKEIKEKEKTTKSNIQNKPFFGNFLQNIKNGVDNVSNFFKDFSFNNFSNKLLFNVYIPQVLSRVEKKIKDKNNDEKISFVKGLNEYIKKDLSYNYKNFEFELVGGNLKFNLELNNLSDNFLLKAETIQSIADLLIVKVETYDNFINNKSIASIYY